MDLSNKSVEELVQIYSKIIKELKNRGILRTKNVIGELGEHIVLEHYLKNPELPTLYGVPVGTQNINALSQMGERYAIKSTSNHVTGVFYGLNAPGSEMEDKKLFEYVILCKFDDDCAVEGIYQLSWNEFQKHKKWHSRMRAWNLVLTRALKDDSFIIFEKGKETDVALEKEDNEIEDEEVTEKEVSIDDEWNKTEKVNHERIRSTVANWMGKRLGMVFEKNSQSRYISANNNTALFVLSASYSQKNQEYWYSINDENIPWLELYPESYLAFALGSDDKVLLFSFVEFKKILEGCLRTKGEGKKKAHFHISFAVDGLTVYFKKKKPEHDFINVSSKLV
jgi:hypothetical protein